MTSPLGTGVVSTYPVNAGIAPNIDPLLVWGYRWGSGPVGTPATVTYSFPAAGATWIGDYWDNEPFDGFSAFSAAQQNAARQAMAAWSEVANITFVQVADTPSNVGDIRFGNSNVVTNSSASAWAYFPYSTPSFEYPEAGDVWFDAKYSPNLQLQPGQFGYSTMIHEIGHAIGLDHPFADQAGEIALPPNLDNESYTIMSYTINDTTRAYASSPMLFDILAIQYIYGANMTTRTGNDVYKYSASVEVQKTIWDAGGIDTLDFSNQTRASTIDLHAGTFTRFGGTTATTSSLIAIAYGVTIENAIGGSAGDNIVGNDADNMLDGRGGADVMYGGAGNDIYVIDNAGDVVDEGANSDAGDELRSANILLSQRYAIENYTYTGAAAWNFTSQAGENNRLTGGSGGDTLNGWDGNDTVLGNAGNDYLIGSSGDDYLDGGIGADKLKGAAGSDTYVIDNAGDTIDEFGTTDGVDKVLASISINLTTLSSGLIEHATLLGTGALNATGNEFDNILTGNDGANMLDGLGGADVMTGGKGNDTYAVDSIGDQVIETLAGAPGGTDLVQSSISFSLFGGNVENLTLLGATAINAQGNGLANVLMGNDGANRLIGGGGGDTMIGGKGDDTYSVDSAGDIVSETIANNLGGGVDVVESSVTFSLASLGNVENLTLMGNAAINGTGNALANTIRGNVAANTLDGGAGADLLTGGAGNDTYIIDNLSDLVNEEGNADTGDTIITSVLYAGPAGGAENIYYTGSGNRAYSGDGGDNVLSGGSGSDTLNGQQGNDTVLGNGGNDTLLGFLGDDYLDGGAGNDKLFGGAGDDTYILDSAGDVVDEEGNADLNDTVKMSAVIAAGFADIENYVYTGAAAWNFTAAAGANNKLTGGSGIDTLNGWDGNDTILGNGGNDYLIGSSGDDYLDGGIGADKLKGAVGNDTYVIDNAGDTIDEFGTTDGVDKVLASISINLTTLGAGLLEHATLLGTAALDATGNALDNTLTGNDGANVLDGLGGADTLAGGKGNDTYVVDNIGDQVIEGADGGVDTVQAAFSLAVASFANIENLTLTGSANIDATGDGGVNVLTGNEGNNILDGGGGPDTLIGGKGDDTYIVGGSEDTVLESISNALGGGIDTVITEFDYSIASNANIDNITITGSAFGFIYATGNARANILTGGSGLDNLAGGDGDDQLIGNQNGDHLIGGIGNDYFLGGEGQDSIWTNAGRDVIDLDAWSDRGDTIYDFTVGSGGDVLDLHDLLVDIGYVGSDPFADGYLSFSSGGIGTNVNVDTDGHGSAVPFSITVATLLSVTLTQADTDNYIV